MPKGTKRVLESRIAEIDKRRAAIEAEMRTVPKNTSRYLELKTEYDALFALRMATQNELSPPKNPHAEDHEQRRQRIIASEEARLKTQYSNTADQFAKQGDHRNARIWRLEIFRIRELLEQQYPPLKETVA